MTETSRPILGVAHTPPAFTMPAGACDSHTHVFGPAARYTFAASRRYTPGDASLEDLSALHRRLGISRVVIVHPSPYGTDNACTIDALRRLGDMARGVAVIDEATDDAELESMHALGVRGVRLNLVTAGTGTPAAAADALRWAAARVAPLGWHVQVFADLDLIDALHEVIRGLPVALVVDHFGHMRAEHGLDQPGISTLRALVAAGKAWVKLSAAQRVSALPDCADVAPIARALIAANPERMLWGSDWPHPGGGFAARDPAEIEPFHPVDDGAALNRLALWAGDADTLAAILVRNPARLYDF